MTLAERFDQWAQQYEQRGKQEGLQKGRQEGQQEGEARLLLRLLTRRFGELPADTVTRIQRADLPQLEAWSDRVLDARSLAEVFQPS